MNNLLKLRKKIDACDRELIHILSKRFFLVKKVALHKKAHKLKPLDPKRWQEVVNTVSSLAEKKRIPKKFVESFMNLIHKESLSIEKRPHSRF